MDAVHPKSLQAGCALHLHQTQRCCQCRAFKLSGPHPKVSKQAVLRRTQTEMGEELTFKPCLVARRRSVSAGRQRPAPATGAGRIDQLAKPRTQLWAKCEMESHKGRVGSLAF